MAPDHAAAAAFAVVADIAMTAVFDLTPKPERVERSAAKSWSKPSRRHGEDAGGLRECAVSLPGW